MAPRAELSAEFALEQLQAARQWLADNGRRGPMRRVIRADGGSRAWINGRPVTLAQLGDLASLLVEIHGQHEQQALLARPSLALLDAYAGNENERRQVRHAAGGRHWSMNRWRCRNRAT